MIRNVNSKEQDVEQIDISAAALQLQEASDEVARIRARITELRNGDNAIARGRREREMADALLAGGDVAEMVAVPVSSAQVRQAVRVLESRLAEALDQESHARGALRSAKVRRMRELFAEHKRRYDVAAAELLRLYAETSALGQELASAVGGVAQLPAAWYQLQVPMGESERTRNPFLDTGLHPGPMELMAGVVGNAARAEVKAMLKQEGIE